MFIINKRFIVFIRLLLAMLIAPVVSALLVTIGVFTVDFFRGAGFSQDLLGKRDFLAFLNYWVVSLWWCYAIAFLLGIPVLFLVWISGHLSRRVLIIGAGLIAQVFPFLAWAESDTSWNIEMLGISLFSFIVGTAGGATFYIILGQQKEGKI